MQITPPTDKHGKELPNDWVALDKNYAIIDRSDTFHPLVERLKARGITPHCITKNWMRPVKVIK